ncbi:hypothetical protein P280DRAFT_518573 [Massarina eburnea CBS 473.64]|uniref:Uncharacterized protein n=1 Tax=Massarina eburnea CBS 473.64 TaxID=1395130 RepID=A0A6A6RX46_9PLEO|nr:hypothetical protein P280DRAFT_518573 [Massarina eburnea CBS 473.64]
MDEVDFHEYIHIGQKHAHILCLDNKQEIALALQVLIEDYRSRIWYWGPIHYEVDLRMAKAAVMGRIVWDGMAWEVQYNVGVGDQRGDLDGSGRWSSETEAKWLIDTDKLQSDN